MFLSPSFVIVSILCIMGTRCHQGTLKQHKGCSSTCVHPRLSPYRRCRAVLRASVSGESKTVVIHSQVQTPVIHLETDFQPPWNTKNKTSKKSARHLGYSSHRSRPVVCVCSICASWRTLNLNDGQIIWFAVRLVALPLWSAGTDTEDSISIKKNPLGVEESTELGF